MQASNGLTERLIRAVTISDYIITLLVVLSSYLHVAVKVHRVFLLRARICQLCFLQKQK